MKNLIRNAIMTPDGTILESTHRHDYRTYMDTNGLEYMVDGGLDYARRNIHLDNPAQELSLYDDEPHSVQREVLKWGSYGKDGKSPLRRIKIADMDKEHIEAVLDECRPSLVLKNCMIKELKERKE